MFGSPDEMFDCVNRLTIEDGEFYSKHSPIAIDRIDHLEFFSFFFRTLK